MTNVSSCLFAITQEKYYTPVTKTSNRNRQQSIPWCRLVDRGTGQSLSMLLFPKDLWNWGYLLTTKVFLFLSLNRSFLPNSPSILKLFSHIREGNLIKKNKTKFHFEKENPKFSKTSWIFLAFSLWEREAEEYCGQNFLSHNSDDKWRWSPKMKTHVWPCISLCFNLTC